MEWTTKKINNGKNTTKEWGKKVYLPPNYNGAFSYEELSKDWTILIFPDIIESLVTLDFSLLKIHFFIQIMDSHLWRALLHSYCAISTTYRCNSNNSYKISNKNGWKTSSKNGPNRFFFRLLVSYNG